jgi:general secretion pathway protein K
MSSRSLPGRRPTRRRQRGVALIIALILVALATILATKLTFDGWLEQRRTFGVLAAEQALHFGMGAEALAADVLSQNAPTGGQTAGGQVTLAQPWAQPTQPLPLTPENDPEGEPIGTLQGELEDMQGRFNLNNLGHFIKNLQTQESTPDPFPLEQFQRLLLSVGLEAKWAGIARDWIDADDLPGSPDGAEDSVYTSQTPAYRTGNWPMTSPSELMNMPGFGADRYRKIAPYVTALPTAIAPINMCTAPALVLESLAANLNGEWSRNPEVLAGSRKTGCFPDTGTLTNMMGGGAAFSKIADRVKETSQYFRLTTRVTLGTTEFTLYSLLQQTGAHSGHFRRTCRIHYCYDCQYPVKKTPNG